MSFCFNLTYCVCLYCLSFLIKINVFLLFINDFSNLPVFGHMRLSGTISRLTSLVCFIIFWLAGNVEECVEPVSMNLWTLVNDQKLDLWFFWFMLNKCTSYRDTHKNITYCYYTTIEVHLRRVWWYSVMNMQRTIRTYTGIEILFLYYTGNHEMNLQRCVLK